jgi:hypothetical protein
MSTSFSGAIGGEKAGVTASVTTLLASGASGLSLFSLVGLVESASFVLILEENGGLFACVCAGIQSFAEKIVPLLLSRREVDASCCGASESGNIRTEAGDSAVT